jgi:NDP-sugar pyrophosphorylase family protein
LAAHGVCDVVLSIGHRGEMIEEVVGDGAGWGVQVSYARDGQTLLGTGGAVRKAVDEGLLRDHFFVMYGDSFLPVDFASIDGSFLASGRPALMAVFHNRQRYDKGNVLYRDGLVELYQKDAGEDLQRRLEWIDYGVSVLTAAIIRRMIPAGAVHDLSAMCHALSKSGELAGFEVAERFFEIGSIEGLRDFEAWTEKNKERLLGAL